MKRAPGRIRSLRKKCSAYLNDNLHKGVTHMENKRFVFVYGTLRRNERNHRLLEGATCIAEQAWTTGTLFNTNSGYPILQDQDSGFVYGELYEATQGQLARLDTLEGYRGEGKDNFYDRIPKTIITDHGEYSAYVYVKNEQQADMLHNHIIGGDWKVYSLLQQSSNYYFAYGSCMDDRRFKEANVNHYFNKSIGRGILDGYTLRFTRRSFDGGRADIVEEGGVVEGQVYEIPYEAISYLYKREGVTSGCYRPAVVDVEMDGWTVKDVLTFVGVNKEEELAPPDHYMEEILRGGGNVLSAGYLEGLGERYNRLKG